MRGRWSHHRNADKLSVPHRSFYGLLSAQGQNIGGVNVSSDCIRTPSTKGLDDVFVRAPDRGGGGATSAQAVGAQLDQLILSQTRVPA